MENNINHETPINSLRRLILKDDSNDFTLLFKIQNKEYQQQETKILIQTTINKARVISKNINKLYEIDPTLCEYVVNIPICENNEQIKEIEEIIQKILKSAGEVIYIEKKQEHLFNIINFLLGKDDEKEGNQPLISNIIEALSFLNTNMHYRSIKYLSSHFFNFINDGSFISISNDIIKEIFDLYFLNQKTIQKSQEKSNQDREEKAKIFEKMIECKEDKNIVLYFLLNLHPNEFNDQMIKFFYSEVNDEMIKNNISPVIKILRNHISSLISANKKRIKSNKKNIIKCDYKNDELNGIISYFKNHQNKNNQSNKDSYEEPGVSCGGKENPLNLTSNIIKYDSDNINNDIYNNYGYTPTENDSWIEFDFGERKINISSYTIRTNKCFTDCDSHPKSWYIEGSNDKKQWTLINKQENNSDLNGSYFQHRFICEKNNNFYRYIRYIQNDTWYSNKQLRYKIRLTCFEFFGSILIHQ